MLILAKNCPPSPPDRVFYPCQELPPPGRFAPCYGGGLFFGGEWMDGFYQNWGKESLVARVVSLEKRTRQYEKDIKAMREREHRFHRRVQRAEAVTARLRSLRADYAHSLEVMRRNRRDGRREPPCFPLSCTLREIDYVLGDHREPPEYYYGA